MLIFLIEFNGQEITPKALDNNLEKFFLGVIKLDTELPVSESLSEKLN